VSFKTRRCSALASLLVQVLADSPLSPSIDWEGVFNVAPDYESYSFTPLDFKKPEDREFVEGCWAWTNEVDGLKYADGKVMK